MGGFPERLFGGILGVSGCVFVLLILWLSNREISWRVEDVESGAVEFDSVLAKSVAPPLVEPVRMVRIDPVPGAALTRFDEIRFWFSRPVNGAHLSRIVANDTRPKEILGAGAGPYVAKFDGIVGKPVGLSFGDGGEMVDREGSTVELTTEWHYQTATPESQSQVDLVELRVRAADAYPSTDDLPKPWLSLRNRGNFPVNCRGWRVEFVGENVQRFLLPHRGIPPNSRTLIALDSLRSPEGPVEGGRPPSKGRFILSNADSTPRVLEQVDYEFTSADLRLALIRTEQGWRYVSLWGDEVQVKGDSLDRLPGKPIPDLPPGRYQRGISVNLVASEPEDEIWYTLNGSAPWKSHSRRYTGPIEVETPTVIKACVRRNGVASEVGTYHYTVGEDKWVPSLPALALSVLGGQPIDGEDGDLPFPQEQDLATHVEFWGRDGKRVGFGGFLRPLAPEESRSRSRHGAPEFRVVMEAPKVREWLRANGMEGSAVGRDFHCRPAFGPDASEGVDWMVQEVGAQFHLSRERGVFFNLVVNAHPIGLYRLIPSPVRRRNPSVEGGSSTMVTGQVDEWESLFRTLITTDFTHDQRLRLVEGRFDLGVFADYVLQGMFWGDRYWPSRGEQVTQNEGAGSWSFQMGFSGASGSLWGKSQFTGFTDKLSASGLIFDSLKRSLRFRTIFARRARSLLEAGPASHVFLVGRARDSLQKKLGAASNGIARGFSTERVQSRLDALGAYLVKGGWLSNDGVQSEATGEESGAVAQASVAVRQDHGMIGPGMEKRVWIPMSDRLALAWTKPGFDDASWLRVEGLVGYDKTGLSGKKLYSRLQELIYNRSSSAYVRIPFHYNASGRHSLERLILRCKVNDGFVAYLNGVEVARFNVPPAPKWNSKALVDMRGTAWRFREFDITAARTQLKEGTNVLAIHALNSMLNGLSFLIDAELVGRKGTGGSTVAPFPPQAASRDGRFSPASPLAVSERCFGRDSFSPMECLGFGHCSDEPLPLRDLRVVPLGFDFRGGTLRIPTRPLFSVNERGVADVGLQWAETVAVWRLAPKFGNDGTWNAWLRNIDQEVACRDGGRGSVCRPEEMVGNDQFPPLSFTRAQPTTILHLRSTVGRGRTHRNERRLCRARGELEGRKAVAGWLS